MGVSSQSSWKAGPIRLSPVAGALPSSLRNSLRASLQRPADDDERDQIRQELESFAASSATAADEALRAISPEAVLDTRNLRRALRANSRTQVLSIPGANRFIWIAGAAACGSQTGKRELIGYFESVGQWLAGHFCAKYVPAVQADLSPHVSLNDSFEQLRRIFPTTIQFRWVSQLILQQVADEIASDPQSYESIADITRPIVNEVFADLIARGQDNTKSTRDTVPLTDAAEAFIRSISCPSGSLSNTPFSALAVTTDIEKFPYVSFESGCRPLAIREAQTGLEQAVFELARRRLPTEKARGDLFERVAARCIDQVCPEEFTERQPPLRVPIPGSKDPGEVDVAFTAEDGTLLLGECKAYFVNPRTSSVINAFAGDMRKAAGQLAKRAVAIKDGSTLLWGHGRSLPGRPSRVLSIGIPLHSYATAVWNNAALKEAEAVRQDLGIFPLHQLLIVMQSMRNAGDLAAYIDVRFRLQRSGTNIADECDMLILHLNPNGRTVLADAESVGPGESFTIAPCSISVADALNRDRPENRGEWRRWLYSSVRVDRSTLPDAGRRVNQSKGRSGKTAKRK